MSFLLNSQRFGGPATTVLNFAANTYTTPGGSASTVATIPNISVARASAGFAQTAAGALTSFASGVARQTDLGLLVEPARTNLITYSDAFSDAAWTKARLTVTADATNAPDGTATADTLNEGVLSGIHIAQAASATITSGQSYAMSCYAKDIDGQYLNLWASRSAVLYASAVFDLSTGAV
jgi:hypothetical protein